VLNLSIGKVTKVAEQQSLELRIEMQKCAESIALRSAGEQQNQQLVIRRG
jgi:hypothetical protein